jgi:hypothetical protein
LASDLASLIGSFSAFCDPEELDGFIASILIMPYLMGNVILNTARRRIVGVKCANGRETFSEMTQSAAMQRIVNSMENSCWKTEKTHYI